MREKLSAEHWPQVCRRALENVSAASDARLRVVYSDPKSIRSATPVAWLDAYGYRIPVPMLDGAEWHYRRVEGGQSLQIRYGRLFALGIVREKQEVIRDIAEVRDSLGDAEPANAGHRRTLMADIFGEAYTRDDALRHAFRLVPDRIDCGRDRFTVIHDMLALANKTDIIASPHDRAYEYYGAFDGFVIARELDRGTLWSSRVWRRGWRLRVHLHVGNDAPVEVKRLGMGLVHHDFVKAPSGGPEWVSRLNEALPDDLLDPLPLDSLPDALGPVMNDGS